MHDVSSWVNYLLIGQITTFITVTYVNSCKIKHSHKKRKDSLETRVVYLTFSIELRSILEAALWRVRTFSSSTVQLDV